jgi:hypothetical protein
MSASRFRLAATRSVLLAALGAALVPLVVAAPAAAADRFRDSSLFGTYAAVGAGDGHVSSSVGTVTYDGAGNLTRLITVNAPGPDGTRRRLVFDSVGVYEVRPDGTGFMTIHNEISNGTSNDVTIDFVIQDSRPNGKGGQRLATKLFGVQREPGTTVSLVTTTETLTAP